MTARAGPTLDGRTKPFAVLGHPIGHTLSPAMHNAALAALGWNAVYLAFDVHPDRLMDVLPAMGAMGFGGVNLTVPLKEVAFRGLARHDESARLVGSVNTVEFAPEGPVGHSTDGHGFLKSHEEAFGASVEGASVFVLGTGGAGRAVALVCARAGAAAVTLSDVDAERLERVRAEAAAVRPGVAARAVAGGAEAARAAREADLVVQATPVGMKPGDPSLLPPEAFRPGQRAFDLIYTFPETAFMRAARAGGARAINGLDMLLHQGVRSFEIWTGVTPPDGAMREALRRAVYGAA